MEEVEVVRAKFGEAKWIGAAAAVAMVVGLTVGGAAALKVAGGGAQPEDVLPANAIAFTKLDLNPSAGQKLAAYRLASKFPQVKDKLTSEDTSIKEAIFGSIFTGPKSLLGLDYKKEVEPWLGDRIGVGVFPDMNGDKLPEVGIAVAVTDEEAAKVALDKAIVNASKVVIPTKFPPSEGFIDPTKPPEAGYAFADGYVILSDTTANATKLAQAGKAGSLAKSKYAEDVEKLGSDQIGVAWADIAAVYKAIPADQLEKALAPLKNSIGEIGDPKKASGRVVVGLHADPSFLEVTAKAIDIKGLGSPSKDGTGTGLIASYPADVFLAVSSAGLGERVGALYTSFTANGDPRGIKSGLAKMGISSAKHLETLLGAETGLMASGTGLGMGQLEFAYRTRGGDAEAALVMARRLVDASPHGGSGIKYSKVTDPDGIVVAKGPGLTGAIFDKSGSKLGGSEAFKQVVPDAGKADFAAYVDLTRFMAMVPKRDPKAWDSLKPIEALGITATGGAEPSFRLRVSVK